VNETELSAIIGRSMATGEEAFDAARSMRSAVVTLGERGAVAVCGSYVSIPAFDVTVVDTVGAGDAFAAAFVHGLAAGWPSATIADFANRAGAAVAAVRGAIPAR
jgi:sugar/nucleoside kinase (ribokinase family)